MYSRRHSRYEAGKQLKRTRKKYWITLALVVMTTYFLYRAIFAKFTQDSPLTVDKIRRDHDRQLAIIQAETRVYDRKYTKTSEAGLSGRFQKSRNDITGMTTDRELKRGNAIQSTEWREITILDDEKKMAKTDRKTPVVTADNHTIHVPEISNSKNTRASELHLPGKVDPDTSHKIQLNYSSKPLGQINILNSTKQNTNATRKSYTVETIKDEQRLTVTQPKRLGLSGNRTVNLTSTDLNYTSDASVARSTGKGDPKAFSELLLKLNSTSDSKPSSTNAITLYQDDGTDTPNECVNLYIRGKISGNRTSIKICIHNTNDDRYISGIVKAHGTWEQGDLDEMGAIFRTLPDMTMIDLGCNIGVYSLYAATLGNRVIAIDPYKKHLKLLDKSLKLNHQEHAVTVLWNAVSKEHAMVNISQSQEHNLGSINIRSGNPPRNISDFSVKTITLNDLIDKFKLDGQAVFLKMDIEGSEYNALVGGINFFKRVNVCYVLLEFVSYKMHERGEEIIEFMKKFQLHPFSDLRLKERLDLAGVPLKNYPLNTVFAKDTLECRRTSHI